MQFEDMLYEQKDSRTWFEITDGINACPVKLLILQDVTETEDTLGLKDHIELIPHDGIPIDIRPQDALHILKWLTYHHDRLKQAAIREMAEGIEVPIDEVAAWGSWKEL